MWQYNSLITGADLGFHLLVGLTYQTRWQRILFKANLSLY